MSESVKNQQQAYLFRPAYFNRQMIQARHLSLEQDYQDQLRAMDAQYLSGWGMVTGAEVKRGSVGFPWMVAVTPGYGKTAQGEPVYIESQQQLNLHQQALACMKGGDRCAIDPKKPDAEPVPGEGHTGYLLARYKALREQKEPQIADECKGTGNDYGIGGRCYGVAFDFVCDLPFAADQAHAPCDGLPEELGKNANTLILATIEFDRSGITRIDMSTHRHQVIPYLCLLEQVKKLEADIEVLKACCLKQPDEPIVDEPIVDEPIIDVPIIVDPPRVDPPIVDVPIRDEPIIDVPIIVDPVADPPRVDEPVIDRPIVDEPIVDRPIVDRPIVDRPIVDTPIVDTPIVDTPIVDTPIVDTPIVDRPIVDRPIVDRPIVDRPIVDLPVGGRRRTRRSRGT